MSSFTTIKNSKYGLSFQIKCGWDICETYDLGEKVNQYPIKDCAGHGYLLDGIYEDTCGEGYVVIKDAVVVEVENTETLKKLASTNYTDPEDEEGWINIFGYLKDKWQIIDPPRSLWDEEAWKRKEELDAKIKSETEEFKKSIAHLPPEEQFKLMMIRPIMRNINCKSMIDKMFSIEPIKQGKKCI